MTDVRLDDTAKLFIPDDCARRTIRLVANEPDLLDAAEYREKRTQVMNDHDLTDAQDFIFVEITVRTPQNSRRSSTSKATSPTSAIAC